MDVKSFRNKHLALGPFLSVVVIITITAISMAQNVFDASRSPFAYQEEGQLLSGLHKYPNGS